MSNELGGKRMEKEMEKFKEEKAPLRTIGKKVRLKGKSKASNFSLALERSGRESGTSAD